MSAVSAFAPLALRFAGIAWPLASERVVVRVERQGDLASLIEADWGPRLRVVPDLPAPVLDEGPLGPAAAALRDAALPGGQAVRLAVEGARPGRPGFAAALRRAALAALRGAGGALPPARDPLEVAIDAGRPADARGPIDVPAARVAWLSERLVLFDDPFTSLEAPRLADHAVADVDPRLVLEAEPAALVAALTGHGVPDRPGWREEHLDRALREAGLLARFRPQVGVGLALVEPGRRRELEAALTEHGLAPARCDLGGPGVTAGVDGA